MVDEMKERIVRVESTARLAKELSDVSRQSVRTGFNIQYTATPGNVEVHERFLKYAFEEANNEYLVAISKLLECAEWVEYLKQLSARLDIVESKVAELTVKPVTVVNDNGLGDIKTF